MKTEDLVKKAIYTLLRKYGSVKKAAIKTGIGRSTLDNALNTGTMTLSTLEIILIATDLELELVTKNNNLKK